MLCADARHANPRRAEPKVIALHTAWPRLPAIRRLVPSDSTTRLLAHIVRLAIAEFYDDRVGAMGDKDNTRAADFERPAAPAVERREARR
jgi:hypothetical protein